MNSSIITLDQIQKSAPAILATEPVSWIKSNSYVFTPSTMIIESLSTLGFELIKVKQARSKDDNRIKYGNHVMVFENPNIKLNPNGDTVVPQIVVLNSHDGTKQLQFEIGIFRLICENGLVVKSIDLGSYKHKHMKYTLEGIREMVKSKVNHFEKLEKKISIWQNIEVPNIILPEFAEQAFQTRFKALDRQANEMEIAQILKPRRNEDIDNSLWNVYNRVQENIVKGFETGEKKIKQIKNHNLENAINQDLWEITEKVELELV